MFPSRSVVRIISYLLNLCKCDKIFIYGKPVTEEAVLIPEAFYYFKQGKRPTLRLVFFRFTNCLIVTPTHDAYLENGTCIGLIVGEPIIAYAERFVKMRKIPFSA